MIEVASRGFSLLGTPRSPPSPPPWWAGPGTSGSSRLRFPARSCCRCSSGLRAMGFCCSLAMSTTTEQSAWKLLDRGLQPGEWRAFGTRSGVLLSAWAHRTFTNRLVTNRFSFQLPIASSATPPTLATPTSPTPTGATPVEAMKLSELQLEAQRLGLKKGGRKDTLVKRIKDF